MSAGAPSEPAVRAAARSRRAARRRWTAGVIVAVVFHGALIALTRVDLGARARADHLNPRITWVGDRLITEEDSSRGQLIRLFDDAPLFLPTAWNFASARRSIEETRAPGEIFARYPARLVMPDTVSPPGLVVAPEDRTEPAVAAQAFRWHYLARFGRDDPPARALPARVARVEARDASSGRVVLAAIIPPDAAPPNRDTWPDWRPFELFVTVSATGRLAETVAGGVVGDPVLGGGGSGSEVVDQFLRGYLRSRLRLDLRLPPGDYQVTVGP